MCIARVSAGRSPGSSRKASPGPRQSPRRHRHGAPLEGAAAGLILLVVVALVAAAAASPALARTGPDARAASVANAHAVTVPSTHVATVPSTHAAATTYGIGGSVLGYSGAPVAGAGVYWGWFNAASFRSTWQQGGAQTTGSTGAFSFAAVTAHPGNDALFAYYNPVSTGLWLLESWNLDFSTQSSFTFQPGHVAVTIGHAPKGSKVADAEVGGAAGIAESRLALSAGAGAAGALPPGFNDVVAWFGPQAGRYRNQLSTGTRLAEAEWLSPADAQVAVSSGAPAAQSVALDWSQALRAHLYGPVCRHSGRPGSVARIVAQGWPAGSQASFYGYSLSGSGDVAQPYADQVDSTSPATAYTVPLTIPTTATVGEIYLIDTWRSDDTASLVNLYDYFQVCTFKATAASVARGGTVRLSGHVPGSGYVEVFLCHGAAGQPATLKAKGWTAVGRYPLKSGKFATPAIHLTRSTWFVARYPGQKGEYFSAFTSVVKVAVR